MVKERQKNKEKRAVRRIKYQVETKVFPSAELGTAT